MKKTFGDNFFYILYFQEPGPADAELNRDPATTMRRLMGSLTTTDETAALRMLQPGPEGFIDRIPEPGRLPDWISQHGWQEVAETALSFVKRFV